MATFDQLSAEQQAILELVLKRGQGYGELADMLGMTPERVQELARDALVKLSPVSAKAVEADWRGQLADYVLGQQSGPESTATRGHLRRSESARTWTRSLLDSLDTLYQVDMPQIPDGGGRDRGRDRRPARAARAAPAEADAGDAKADDTGDKPREELSPEAEAVVRRRRLIGAGAGAAVVLLVVVLLWPIGLLTGDDDNGGSGSNTSSVSTNSQAAQTQIVGGVQLKPVAGAPKSSQGAVYLTQANGQLQLAVQAKVKPSTSALAYQVWLYNSPSDAKSLGANATDRNGGFTGSAPLPRDYKKYKYIDLSLERIKKKDPGKHTGQSILRAPIAGIKPIQQQQQQSQQQAPQGGTQTSP